MKLRKSIVSALCVLMGLAFVTANGYADEPIRVLFLSKSTGFQHSVIQRKNNELGHSEKIMLELGAKNGMDVVCTKDAGTINADQLKNFDVVMFYTTGDLTKADGEPGKNKDNGTPMAEGGVDALYKWVQEGGAFCGMHTAADTFHDNVTYRKLSGGVFKTHGKQEVAKCSVVKKHPITAHLGDSITLMDEWYIFRDSTGTYTPLLQLETKGMEQDLYKQLEPYPITWIEEVGKGRIFNTALGHREDVWTNPDFQKMLVNGIKWAAKKLD